MSQLSNIINREYQNQSIELTNPMGSVVGYQRNDSLNQRWYIVSIGGNNLTIRNGSTGTYAAPESENEGANVVGRPNQYAWQQLQVPGGWFQIATANGDYVWQLTSGDDYAPVVLQAAPYQGQDAQWGYDPAGN